MYISVSIQTYINALVLTASYICIWILIGFLSERTSYTTTTPKNVFCHITHLERSNNWVALCTWASRLISSPYGHECRFRPLKHILHILLLCRISFVICVLIRDLEVTNFKKKTLTFSSITCF